MIATTTVDGKAVTMLFYPLDGNLALGFDAGQFNTDVGGKFEVIPEEADEFDAFLLKTGLKDSPHTVARTSCPRPTDNTPTGTSLGRCHLRGPFPDGTSGEGAFHIPSQTTDMDATDIKQ